MTVCLQGNGVSSDDLAEAVSWRRDIHRHPELAYNERRTADLVAAHLVQGGLTVHRGLAGTGVVGTLTRGTSRRVIAIRADMDALPIQERTGAPHSSCVPGMMHACGHDGHIAMALAAARICARRRDLDGTVHFIFQPAEENEGGGQRMIKEGLFRKFPCDAIYALHNWPTLPIGTCVALDGAMMAALATFEITISGRGCHGAAPHEGTDCILAACHLVSALQSIVSRNTEPLRSAVISATQIHSGETWNVIPDECIIRGTTRWFDEDVGSVLYRRIVDMARLTAASFDCSAVTRYDKRFLATVNDPSVARFVRHVAASSPVNCTLVDARPSMCSEDFSSMLKEVPGCYFWLGAGSPGETFALHSSRYDFNDRLLPLGIALWVSLVRNSLKSA